MTMTDYNRCPELAKSYVGLENEVVYWEDEFRGLELEALTYRLLMESCKNPLSLRVVCTEYEIAKIAAKNAYTKLGYAHQNLREEKESIEAMTEERLYLLVAIRAALGRAS